MKFNSELLKTNEQNTMDYNSSYKGCYSTMQFVIRLRNDVRYQLNEEVEITPEKFQAFSTYLHETIHWWQHIGSNFGFILNTSYPSFVASSFKNLKELVDKGLFYKSLLKFDEKYYSENGVSDIKELNIIVNNFFDLEYAKRFSLDNKNISRIIEDKRFFLNIGHCYMILWTNSIFLLSETIDKDFHFLPNINNWVPIFKELEENKVEGFHIDTDYHVAPLGIKAIYEGQAIFNQIIYLKNVFKKNNIIYKDFIDNGMLHGIYLEAFNIFLKILNEETPFFLDDSLIGLFLLVCDISINPNNGFPIEIYDFENFINKNNPGMRFILICNVISEKKEYYLTRCKDLSKETYIDLSKLLNKKIGCKCSYKIIERVLDWTNSDEIKRLLIEEEKHSYDEVNMPFRLFMAKYIRFQQDKFENPHFLCWIGHHMTNAENNEVMNLFEKHSALFTDSDDGEIKPIILNNVDEEHLYKTFNKFYQHTILYELVLKWISEDGDFKLDYKWLFNNRNEENIPRIKDEFKRLFNVELDEVKTL